MPAKRASSFISRKLGASVTVEAAFALPLFLFFMVQVISAVNMIGIQSRFAAALHQTGNRMAFAGYAYGKAAGDALPGEIAMTVLSRSYAESQVIKSIGRDYLDKSCIRNGAAGVSFYGTSIMQENDIIEICLSCRLEPLFPITGFQGFALRQRYYGRAWTGYDVEGSAGDSSEDDPMVYITETGTVYHTDRNCTYLNLSVQAVDAADIGTSRNQSGGKYAACGICGRKNVGGTVYITAQGNSYHCMITCSGLKRTVYTVPLSQTGGRGKCSKCR
ncbi:MAG: hypothetical protein NC341_12350 [Blautia sp.]|nr:hypothetical protein [Blautia sp.]MCM1199918.1 hypothetical protein [Bacteroides fragilis]